MFVVPDRGRNLVHLPGRLALRLDSEQRSLVSGHVLSIRKPGFPGRQVPTLPGKFEKLPDFDCFYGLKPENDTGGVRFIHRQSTRVSWPARRTKWIIRRRHMSGIERLFNCDHVDAVWPFKRRCSAL